MNARQGPYRWSACDWLLWAAGCVLLYAVALAADVAGALVSGHPFRIAEFTTWYAGGLAAATVLVAIRQLRRPRRQKITGRKGRAA